MRRGKWIIFGMLVALLAGCSGKKTEETFADAKNAESTDVILWSAKKYSIIGKRTYVLLKSVRRCSECRSRHAVM